MYIQTGDDNGTNYILTKKAGRHKMKIRTFVRCFLGGVINGKSEPHIYRHRS